VEKKQRLNELKKGRQKERKNENIREKKEREKSGPYSSKCSLQGSGTSEFQQRIWPPAETPRACLALLS
jgi:hypothetical protein